MGFAQGTDPTSITCYGIWIGFRMMTAGIGEAILEAINDIAGLPLPRPSEEKILLYLLTAFVFGFTCNTYRAGHDEAMTEVGYLPREQLGVRSPTTGKGEGMSETHRRNRVKGQEGACDVLVRRKNRTIWMHRTGDPWFGFILAHDQARLLLFTLGDLGEWATKWGIWVFSVHRIGAWPVLSCCHYFKHHLWYLPGWWSGVS